ncbi:MAG: hypothetical protein MUF78_08845 [Candidatus Edwardsbacteria bacterium]|nr:hypothetical protein [Candidatus Edwardsbacteria bacterium]
MVIEEPDTTLKDKYVKETILQAKWGKGEGQLGNFRGPTAIVADEEGNFYLLDYDNKRVNKYDKNGEYITNIVISKPSKGDAGAFILGR